MHTLLQMSLVMFPVFLVPRCLQITNYNLRIANLRIARKVYFFFSKPQLPKQQDGVTVLLDTRRDDTVTDLQFLRK